MDLVTSVNIWALLGFAFAAYAVVGNDALQTLGTFINSNRRLPWWVLYLFAVSILIASFYYGMFSYQGDVSYSKLDQTSKFPVFEVHWYHALPPMMLLLLTRIGIPVSTTFMVLATFATMAGMQSMLTKSLMGYGVAFATGLLVYAVTAPTLERWFLKTADTQHNLVWVVLQWMTTGYLWWMWLWQDFANIFVYLPRNLPESYDVGGEYTVAFPSKALEEFGMTSETVTTSAQTVQVAASEIVHRADVLSACRATVSSEMAAQSAEIAAKIQTAFDRTTALCLESAVKGAEVLARENNLTMFGATLGLALISLFLLVTFINRGGPVQKILLTKTSVTDIRSATVIDFIYATLLFIFSGQMEALGISKVPMSTTWVFLGLIAGREFAIATIDKVRSTGGTAKIVGMDLAKATMGIVISVILALSMPYMARAFNGQGAQTSSQLTAPADTNGQ